MNTLHKMFLAFASVAIMAPSAVAQREHTTLNRDWNFILTPPDTQTMPDGATEGWTTVNVPHDFQIGQPWVAPAADEKADMNNAAANIKSRLSSRGFKEMGTGWYTKRFTAPAEWKGRRVVIDFEGVLLTADVWVNGVKVGGSDYGYLGFEADITPYLKFDGENTVVVRADTGNADNSRWYTGAGIYRDVNVTVTDPKMYFTRHPLYVTTPEVADDRATVKVQAEIFCNNRDVKNLRTRTRITSPAGEVVYDKVTDTPFSRGKRTCEYLIDSLTIERPELWSCETPSLYRIDVDLLRPDGSVADNVSDHFGVRTIEYSPEFGLKLNGKKVLLKGIANHHTLGALGAAAYPAAIEKRLKLLKEFGFNHVRCSHNPYSEEFMDLCDKYGILVVDELYDKWQQQYAGGRKEWMQLWPNDVPEWIKRDRNHPSVVMWSLGNELQQIWDMPYRDWGVTPYRLQKTLMDRFDKTRPTTVAMHPRYRNEKTDSLPAPLVMETDIASYNYRYMYFPGDGRRFPWMIFYQSEANASGMGPNFFEMDLDKVVGLAYWGMIDYLGESNGWPAKGWTHGVFDISLAPKPAAYFLRSYFKPDEPVVHIGVLGKDENLEWNGVNVGTQTVSDHWNYRDGSKLDVYAYTNADEVELFVNGKSQGRKANNVANPKERNRPMWKGVPYAKGVVEAVGYRNGKVIARHRVETAGKASRLTLAGDNPEWKADGTDLQHVVVEALDAKKRRDFGAHQLVEFSVEGPAEIVGVINGDMSSPELTVGSQRSLYQGRAVVILRSKPEAGKVTLTAKGEGYKPVKQTYNTK